MIGADLQSLRLSHDEPNSLGFFVLKKLHSASTSLFPLVYFFIKPIELRLPKTRSYKSKEPRDQVRQNFQSNRFAEELEI